MDWFAAVDIYCERIGPDFWAEPLNAISNIAFPLAAIWAAITARGRSAPLAIWVLITMAAAIGLGSFLFHSFANTWSEYTDTIPIWSFVAAYVFVAIHRVGDVRPGRLVAIAIAVAAILTLLFLASGETKPQNADAGAIAVLNGSEQYAPALIALLVFAYLSWRRQHPMRRWVFAATLTFSISLCFRTVDPLVCVAFPLGSHFMWHILNGLMIGLLLQGLIRTTVPKPAP